MLNIQARKLPKDTYSEPLVIQLLSKCPLNLNLYYYTLFQQTQNTYISPFITLLARVTLALEISKAIDSANPPVIHRDIKSTNVLLGAKMSARLGDFGLALRCHMEYTRVQCTPPAGTLGYLDPSYDVFSFGILLLEIMSGRNVMDADYSSPSIIDQANPLIKKCDFSAICDRRIGPPADASVARQLALLASQCVAVDATRRPEIGKVARLLKEISKEDKNGAWSNNFTRSLSKAKCCETSTQLVFSDIEEIN